MENLPDEIMNQIRKAINIPKGAFSFEYSSEDLMDPDISGGIIFEIISGVRIFRLERTNDLLLKYYYASPGTDTRVATIDLKGIPSSKNLIIIFVWSPDSIQLYLGLRGGNEKLCHGVGVKCGFQLQTAKGDGIIKIGDSNIKVMNLNIYQNGTLIFSPTAINSWRDTIKALEILKTGTSDVGYIYESVQANLTISMLVTGFEAYMKIRVLEMEKEGTIPFLDALFTKEKLGEMQTKFKDEGVSLLQYIIQKRMINFQNYKECKKVFNEIYKIKFSLIGIDSDKLEKLQEYIQFRHKIIHTSALVSVMNQSRVPPEKPIFSNKVLATNAIAIFDEFIGALHQATLKT